MQTNMNALPHVRRRGTNHLPYPVVPAISRPGELPDFMGALPVLGPEAQAMRMGVGYPVNHLTYQFYFDPRKKEGSWHYIYHEGDGELIEMGSEG